MERDKRKKSKMACLFGGNGEISNRNTVQPRSPSDGITKQDSYTIEVGQTSSKQGYGTPMKTLLAKEMSNETSAKKRSPSLIAKLMGLDGLPSPQPNHRQQRKLSDNSHKSTAAVGGKRNEKPFSHQLDDKKSIMEQQQFKDVYEDLEASHVANKHYSPPLSANRRSTKQELGYIQERCDEMLRESIAIKSKLERVDSNSDLMLSFLQKPDSLFVKHLHDQQGIASGSPCNQITVLKPSNFVRHGVHGKGLKEERETFRYCATHSHQRTADRLVGYSSRSTNNSHRSSRTQLERNEPIAISPTRIVVLKPNVAKMYNDNYSVHSPDECRKNTESVCFNSGTGQGGSHVYRGGLGEVRSSRHKSREAREIAKQITSQMKEGFESGQANLFDHGFRAYVGEERMYMSTSASVTESEMMVVPSRNSFDRSDRSKHSPSNMSESSVIREAKKRMSQRWKTHGYKDAGMVGTSSTLEEMLSVPNSEIRRDKTGRVVGLVGASDEYVSPAGSGMPLGISSNDGWRDGYLRNTPRSRSLSPSLRNRSHRTSNYHEAHADEKIVVHNEPLHRGKSKGAKGNFNHIEDVRSKSLRYNKRCRSSQHCNACSLEFANILTESHSRRKPSETCFEDEDPAEQEPLISDIQGATINGAFVVDVIRISSESSNELTPGVDSSAIDEDSSNSQEPSTAKSVGSVSIGLSGPEPESSEGSKEVDQEGQISVVEVPHTEDISSDSDCFERVSSQIHELRKQIHMLKMESGSTYDSQNEEDVDQGSCFTVSESNHWESMYLSDILRGSGFSDNDPCTFMTTLNAVDCPIDPWLFDHLEKKYSEDSSISRSERRLLYDRINEALLVISTTRVACSWVSPGKRGIQMTLAEIGFEDQLQKVLAKQEKEAREDFEEISIDNDPDWFQAVKEIDVVGKQIAELLVNDLVLEIVAV